MATQVRNLVPNPAFADANYAWGQARSTLTRTSDWADTSSGYSGLLSITQTGASSYVYPLSSEGPVTNRISPVVSGDRMSGRVKVKMVRDGGARLTIAGYDSSAAGAGTPSTILYEVQILSAGQEYEFVFHNILVPENPNIAGVLFLIYPTDEVYSVANAPLGDHMYIADAMLVNWGQEPGPGEEAPEYFDANFAGTSRASYSWYGTPNASSSIMTLHPQAVAPLRRPTTTQPSRMSRRGWRYFATRLHGDGTETLLDIDLPLESVTIDDVLSGDQAINSQIEPVYTRLIANDGHPLLKEWSTAIYAENDGDIRSGGILTNSSFSGSSWDLECIGFTGYLRNLPYIGNGYKGIRVDPIDVMRYIWGHAQGKPGGDLGMTFDSTDTDGKVSIGTELKQVEFDTQSGPVSFESGPYKLNWYSNHDLAKDIDDLAADTPFDYHERHFWDGDTIRHHIDIGYPRIGRRRNDLRFVHGVNIWTPVEVERMGELYASGTLVLGAGEGNSMINAVREPMPRPGGRLRRIAIVTDDSIKSKKRAVARADQENQWRSRLDEFDSLIVQDHPNAPLGACQVGDEIRVEGQGDWVGVDMWMRVLAISYQPENGNVAEYSVARTDKLTS